MFGGFNNSVEFSLRLKDSLIKLSVDPIIEGFGKDYELDNKSAYCETCAAISSILWSFEMLLNTGDAKYADLIEWQLYNALNVSMSLDGKSYFYQNPLETNGNLERKEWYKTACCPSNISRTLAKLGRLIYSYNENSLWIHQYIGNETTITVDEKNKKRISCKMDTEIPYYGKTNISISFEGFKEKNLYLRIPSWTSNPSIKVNDRIIEIKTQLSKDNQTASGYSPYKSYYFKIQDDLIETNKLEIDFPVSVKMNYSHRKVKTNLNKIAFSRGPIVYCFESIDNPSACIPNATIKKNSSLETEKSRLFDSFSNIRVKDSNDRTLLAIPYFLWGNRGNSAMQVWINFIEKRRKKLDN